MNILLVDDIISIKSDRHKFIITTVNDIIHISRNTFSDFKCCNFIIYHKSNMINPNIPEHVLVEIFGILTANALDATPVNDSAYVMLNCIGRKIIFKTRNRGFKLLSTHLESFFTPGYSTKNIPCQTKKHTGLGLPTLQKVVIDQYKGRIIISNDEYYMKG